MPLKFAAYFVLGLICLSERASAQHDQDSCGTIGSILRDASAIHPGMSRAELEEEFTSASFTFRTSATYVSRKCAYVSVDVEFETDGLLGVPAKPDDKITKVSRPYLAAPSKD